MVAFPTDAGPAQCSSVSDPCDGIYVEAAAPTQITDRVCARRVVVCKDGEEYESKPFTSTSDRECTALTPCVVGEQFESQAASAISDRTCSTISACTAGVEFEAFPPTATSDRVCEAVSTCKAGTQLRAKATAASDSICQSCPPGSFQANDGGDKCAAVSTCEDGGAYETAAPTPSSDRECSQLTDGCNSATEFESVPATATSDRACSTATACTAGEEYQTVAKTAAKWLLAVAYH